VLRGNPPCLAARVLDDQLGRVTPLELVDPRNLDLELDPELGEDFPPLRRAGR
jgi:hypothetical protein